MLSITNLAAVLAGMPTPTSGPAATATWNPPRPNLGECGKVNVFYTEFPPYHPMVPAQGWDPIRVDIGLRNDIQNMINAGYNVHFFWAGTETPVSVVGERLKQKGVDFDLVGIGWGVRGATIEPVVDRFENLIDMYKKSVPEVPIIFNYSPDSIVWSAAHRLPMREDCAAVGKPGKLLGYEGICDSRCDRIKEKAEMTAY
ncbi:hypothetical protein K4K51_006147 [Colletotrichum sp. SAR 10_75]|nr:hypothetical protein K4K51_006147 [Colletotrichum sp. SAR 10_75]